MEPPAPRSGEDLSRAFRNLPPGTLSGLDALCDNNYWLNVMREAEIEISNEEIFRFRFSEISKTASNRLAFLAGSGEYGAFNLRYLIRQLVEQCSDMHKYTRKLEKYVVKLQQRVEALEAERGPGVQRGDPLAAVAAAAAARQEQDEAEEAAAVAAGGGGGGSGAGGRTSGAGGGGGDGGGSALGSGARGAAAHAAQQLQSLLPPPQPLSGQQFPNRPQHAAGLQPPPKRARPLPPGAGESGVAGQEDCT